MRCQNQISKGSSKKNDTHLRKWLMSMSLSCLLSQRYLQRMNLRYKERRNCSQNYKQEEPFNNSDRVLKEKTKKLIKDKTRIKFRNHRSKIKKRMRIWKMRLQWWRQLSSYFRMNCWGREKSTKGIDRDWKENRLIMKKNVWICRENLERRKKSYRLKSRIDKDKSKSINGQLARCSRWLWNCRKRRK